MTIEDIEEFRKSLPPWLPRTPEWEMRAEARKRRALEELDRLYATHGSTSDIKAADREFEFAHDDLKFGPFRNTEI